jgi:hypothetical protein
MITKEEFEIWRIENTRWCKRCDSLLFKPNNASENWFWEHVENCEWI